MNETAYRLFHTFSQFRKLHFSSLMEDLNHSEFAILKSIAYEEIHPCRASEPCKVNNKISTSDLAKKIRVSPPSISRSLKVMEEKNLITRQINPNDRRNTYILLTENGKAKLLEAEQIMVEFTDSVLAQMDPEHLDLLIQYLQDFYDITQKEFQARSDKMKKEQQND
ncbi:MAG: MarR family transcriptional regulator [Lachnospiraceae bacterium]|nr:MarR family transcriptional regulator [Lachnospiraceae bacterium]